jgi:hypothetical protein
VILFVSLINSETAVWWFVARFDGPVALLIGVGGILALYWGMMGLSKVVRAGFMAIFPGNQK